MPARGLLGRGHAEIHCDRDAPAPDSAGPVSLPRETGAAQAHFPQAFFLRAGRQGQLDSARAGADWMVPSTATAARLTAERGLALSGASSLRASVGLLLARSCASSSVACSLETKTVGLSINFRSSFSASAVFPWDA